MRFRLRHVTTYTYRSAVTMCQNKAHLTPRETTRQTARDCRLLISPEPAILSARLDYFGNQTTFFAVQAPHKQLEVRLDGEVTVNPAPIPKPGETQRWDIARTLLGSDLTVRGLEAFEFVFESALVRFSPEVRAYAEPSFPPHRPMLEALIDLNSRIHKDFAYNPAVTTISTPVTEVLEKRAGVCQDFAHLMIACVRSLGLAARYVSGYLMTTRPAGQQHRFIGADASHAWVSVFIPGNGWVDFDPTNNTIPSDKHITLAWGRDYADVSPIRGVILGGGSQTLTVAVDVIPVKESADGTTEEPEEEKPEEKPEEKKPAE